MSPDTLHCLATAVFSMALLPWRFGAPPLSAPKQEAQRGVVDYAPAVRIDWSKRCVEVDGQVVLREGMLELLACSPNTREHESIVATPAWPRRIYEALALVGLTPGHPVRYDPKAARWLAPTGDRLRIQVRWQQGGRTRTCDVGAWMRDIGNGKIVPPDIWVFAGSYRSEDDRFAADWDGTVVCVVDFGSALIALPELRSADNNALQLQANTRRIPEIGTEVTLLLSALEPVRFELHIGAKGDIRYGGRSFSISDLIDRLERFQHDHEFTSVVIGIDSRAPSNLAQEVEKTVRGSVKPGTEVRVIPEFHRPAVDHSSAPDDSKRP